MVKIERVGSFTKGDWQPKISDPNFMLAKEGLSDVGK